MSLQDQIAKILNDYADGVSEGGNAKPYIDAILALLPSLPGWVKVKECEYYPNRCIAHNEQGGITSNCRFPLMSCHGTGQVTSPLEFEDVDWNELLDFISIVQNYSKAEYMNAIVLSMLLDKMLKFTTKSGEKIVRREK